jgi:hypothetical protein
LSHVKYARKKTAETPSRNSLPRRLNNGKPEAVCVKYVVTQVSRTR